MFLIEFFLNRHGVDLVNESIDCIKQGNRDRCKFLQYLLSRNDLSDQDIVILTLSLFTDGLSTVNTFLFISISPQSKQDLINLFTAKLSGCPDSHVLPVCLRSQSENPG